MRIILVMSEASLWKPEFVADIVRLLPQQHRVVATVLTSFRPRGAARRTHFQRYLTMLGLPLFLRMGFREAWHGLLDRIDRYRRLPRPHSIAGVCRRHGIPVLRSANVNAPETVAEIAKLRPDVLVSSGNQIFREPLLDTARVASINRHTSLLPAYKGIYPLFWCLLNDEAKVGVSIHKMTKKIDDGDVIAQTALSVTADDSFFSLFEKCFGVSGALVVEAIGRLEAGDAPAIDNGKAPSRYSYPTREQVRLFRRKGKRMS